MSKDAINPVFWLWIPLIFIALQVTAEIVLPQKILGTIHNENGPHETLQFIVIIGAFFYALRGFYKSFKDKLLTPWFGLAAICTFYVAGEEISWGQHILEWSTPEFWSEINDQNRRPIPYPLAYIPDLYWSMSV